MSVTGFGARWEDRTLPEANLDSQDEEINIMPLKVSVIVINYNQERFLAETLNSVLCQDYEPVEIVVADDSSTDGSRQILVDYSNLYPEKFVLRFRDKNGGITANRNTALAACTGDLIAYLDGDDLFLPGKISAQAKLFEADETLVLSYHAAEIFDSATDATLLVTNRRKREQIKDARDVLIKMGIPHTSSVMVRRSACPPWGFDEALPHVSDWLFEFEVALKGRIVELSGVYSRYRKHDNNSTVGLSRFLYEFEKALDIIEARYGDQASIADACRRGRARFLAGEAFRNFEKSPGTAQQLLARAQALCPDELRYKAGYLVSKSPITRHAALHAKNWLKRYVG